MPGNETLARKLARTLLADHGVPVIWKLHADAATPDVDVSRIVCVISATGVEGQRGFCHVEVTKHRRNYSAQPDARCSMDNRID